MNSPPEHSGRTEVFGHRVNAALRHPARWVASHAARRRGVASDAPVPTSAQDVLDRLTALRISTWTYGFDHKSIRHLGPMAQDFAASFGLGSSARQISAIDANGVCMASIQALHRKLSALECEVEVLRKQIGRTGPDRPSSDRNASDRNVLTVNNNHHTPGQGEPDRSGDL